MGNIETKKGLPEQAFFKRNRRLALFFVTTVEFVDTTGGVDEFLFAGEEGVALGADTDLVLLAGGFDVPNFAASASHDGITVLGMKILFHVLDSVSSIFTINFNLQNKRFV
jgi:hypothetical protein